MYELAAEQPEGSDEPRLKQQRRRSVARQKRWPDLTEEQVLAWADAHYARTGQWPTRDAGVVTDAPREKWLNISTALTRGCRGLGPGSSLARFLEQHRGVRNGANLPQLTIGGILAWADAHQRRTGRWPTATCGPIEEASGETWMAVHQALRKGRRGLPGGSSLPRLLEAQRGVPNWLNRPLTNEQILAWADAFCRRTGRWPRFDSGEIDGAPGETWLAVDTCLARGHRGLPGGTSLVRLLAEHRSAPVGKQVRHLRVEQILAWADAHFQRTGQWPKRDRGPIHGAPDETWLGVHHALRAGHRGLPGGSSLARLLAERRGVRHKGEPPALSEEQILLWADAHCRRTGRWPAAASGEIPESNGDTWYAVQRALAAGRRGLPGGSSLACLLRERRGMPKDRPLRPLSVAQLLEWVDAHHRRTGEWPTRKSGPLPEAPGENWAALDQALKAGYRGLPAGLTVQRFLADYRGVPHPKERPRLSGAQILAWADAFHARHGRWPRLGDGAIEEAPGENWQGMENSLRIGLRGLPGGSSLHKMVRSHCG